MSKFSRLVRFLATDGKSYYGDATGPGIPSSARVITGDVFGSYSIGESTPIRTLLCPIDPSHVRTVRGIGLNYRKHAEETGLPIPKHPILFHKPVTSLAGPLDPIYIPKGLQAHNASDYECELVIVMGKMAKDVKRHEAMQYILGFTVGNDVSQREWQMSLGGTQWSYSKGFDSSAPIGPQIVSPSVIDPNKLSIKTILNGQTMQDSNTEDLIFDVAHLVAFLSQGTTLMPGDVIFTGTPAGVGMGQKPPVWLKDGDVCQVELEGVGACTNQVIWEREDGVIRQAKL